MSENRSIIVHYKILLFDSVHRVVLDREKTTFQDLEKTIFESQKLSNLQFQYSGGTIQNHNDLLKNYLPENKNTLFLNVKCTETKKEPETLSSSNELLKSDCLLEKKRERKKKNDKEEGEISSEENEKKLENNTKKRLALFTDEISQINHIDILKMSPNLQNINNILERDNSIIEDKNETSRNSNRDSEFNKQSSTNSIKSIIQRPDQRIPVNLNQIQEEISLQIENCHSDNNNIIRSRNTPKLILLNDNSSLNGNFKVKNAPSALEIGQKFYLDFNSYQKAEQKAIDEIQKIMSQVKVSSQKKEVRKEFLLYNNPQILKITNKKSELNTFRIKEHLAMYPPSLISAKTNKKINLILDLDHTLVCTEDENFNYPQKYTTEGVYEISPVINGIVTKLKTKIRSHTFDLIRRLSKICDIYVYTHGLTQYANEIVEIIESKSGIKFKGVYSPDNFQMQSVKKDLVRFSKDESFFDNSLIFDDSIDAWINNHHQNLILSMKFLAFNDENKLDRKRKNFPKEMPYIINNQYFKFDDSEFLLDNNNNPIYLETEYSKTSQIKSLIELVENAYVLSYLRNCRIHEASNEIQQCVFATLKFNLNHNNLNENCRKLLSKIIYKLGGIVSDTDSFATHFLLTKNKVKDFQENVNIKLLMKENKRKFFCVNMKWIIHCYFNYKRLSEEDPEYNFDFKSEQTIS